jgi:regulatory protein
MRKPPAKLDQARLEELALSYVARFATSRTKLARYLERKLRERGWNEENPPDISVLIEKHADLGYLDDEAFARARSGDLMRRGYGPRRVQEALGMAGIAGNIRENLRPDVPEIRHSALLLARKRRFGPFGELPLDPDKRQKQLAAMARAGHDFGDAARLVDATSVEEAEQWAREYDEEPEAKE